MPFINVFIKSNPNLLFTFYLYLQETSDRTTYYHSLLGDILNYNNCNIGYYNITKDDENI